MKSELQSTLIIIRHTLERSRTTIMWWAIGVAIYTLVNIAVYPSLKDSVLMQTQNYPKALVDAFGLSDLGKIGPFVFAKVFSTLPLVLAFLPIAMFAGQLAGAEERGGLDVMLTQPIMRRGYVVALWIVAAISVALVLALTGILSWVVIHLVGEEVGFGAMFGASMSLWPITMAIGTLGLLLSALMRSRGAVLGAGIGVMFLLFLIDAVSKIAPRLKNLGYVSPFHYFGDTFTTAIPVWHPLLLIGLGIGLLLTSIAVFNRRDIYT